MVLASCVVVSSGWLFGCIFLLLLVGCLAVSSLFTGWLYDCIFLLLLSGLCFLWLLATCVAVSSSICLRWLCLSPLFAGSGVRALLKSRRYFPLSKICKWNKLQGILM